MFRWSFYNISKNSGTLCREWFDYDGGDQTEWEPTTAAKNWLSSQGLEQTHDAMCSTSAPWPLENINSIEVQVVCAAICNYCPTNYTVLATQDPSNTTTSTAAPGSAAAKYFTLHACDAASQIKMTASESAGTMCCPLTGGACAGSCRANSTWSVAVLKCAMFGMRLCSKSELLSSLCCGQGDKTCDASYVWTLTHEGDKNNCDPDPCQNDGKCIDGKATFTCNCTEGFTGTICATKTTTAPPTSTDPKTTTAEMTKYPSTTHPDTTASLVYPETTKSPPATTTGYPPTEPPTTTEEPTTTTTELGYPTTDTTTPGYPTTTDPARKLCSDRMKKLCPCGCGFKMTSPKIKCRKIQKRLCPCKCNNL